MENAEERSALGRGEGRGPGSETIASTALLVFG